MKYEETSTIDKMQLEKLLYNLLKKIIILFMILDSMKVG
ncbi:MAG: hypothetical protein RIR97_1380 [Pseudomonadota bacterium]